MLVESGALGERIEIHTPAAIATILGTVVYVAVDPVTSASTFASAHSRVAIQNREEASRETTTISALEQLTVALGQVQEKKTLSQEQLDALGGCLTDFQDLALRAARSSREAEAVERSADVDGAAFEGSFERRSSEKRKSEMRNQDSRDIASEGVIDVTDTEAFRSEFSGGPESPAPPNCADQDPPIPGEHCNF